MFSGIVENSARIIGIEHEPNSDNVHLTLTVPFWDELKIDQSVSHNGVCLTVVSINPDEKSYTVTAIRETLIRSNLGRLKVGDLVNVERSMLIGGRLDGHIVQGHVDTTGTVIDIQDAEGSTYYTIRYKVDQRLVANGYTTVEKGSICVNGVSLTVVDSGIDSFRVAIIPYTVSHTNFHTLRIGDWVNLEFDIIGKYLSRFLEVREAYASTDKSTLE